MITSPGAQPNTGRARSANLRLAVAALPIDSLDDAPVSWRRAVEAARPVRCRCGRPKRKGTFPAASTSDAKAPTESVRLADVPA